MVDSTLVNATRYEVNTTAKALLDALVPLMQDLSRDLPDTERYRRLLQSLRALVPSDATALLRLDGDTLVPLAIDGLTSDTLGRRFRVSEHPRFAQLLAQPEPTRFAADSDLPDPYDGLVKGALGRTRSARLPRMPAASSAAGRGACSRSTRSTRRASTASTWLRCRLS